jgi:hypothetical protein
VVSLRARSLVARHLFADSDRILINRFSEQNHSYFLTLLVLHYVINIRRLRALFEF